MKDVDFSEYVRCYQVFGFNVPTCVLIRAAVSVAYVVPFCPLESLPSARQHPSYGDCLEVKREYYQNCSVLGCVTMFTVSSTLI